MPRRRTAISLLVGVCLLVQGFAVAATPALAMATDESVQHTLDVQSPVACHGDEGEPALADRGCCDAACPDMSSCLFTHIAFVSALATEVTAPQTVAPRSFAVAAAMASPPKSLLRPPIALHA